MKTMRMAVLLGWTACCLLRAEDPANGTAPGKIQVSNTQKMDFPSGGTLRLNNAIGEVTITGWDQSGLEITTIKSTKTAVGAKDRAAASKMLENVKVATERKGDAVTVSTEFPKHSKIARPFEGMTDFDLEYRIQVPRAARLDVEEVMGEVHIENIAGDIRAMDHMGLITVLVPEGSYAIDAKSKLGSVDSDFPGSERGSKWWVVKWPGQTFTSAAASSGQGPAQKMFLRMGYGDIFVLRQH